MSTLIKPLRPGNIESAAWRGTSISELLRGKDRAIQNSGHNTDEVHVQAVLRVVEMLRERFSEQFSLDMMADVARSSRYHFDRIFRDVTGVSPRQFLGLVRLQAAERLLLSTNMSVLDICLEVGYESLGTFTSRFHQYVGVSPLSLRRFSGTARFVSAGTSGLGIADKTDASPGSGVQGKVSTSDRQHGLIYIGLYSSSIPCGLPAGCALLDAPGRYRIAAPIDGEYIVFGASLPRSVTPLGFVAGDEELRIGRSPTTVQVQNGRLEYPVDIILNRPTAIDPPLVAALPILLNQKLSRSDCPISV